MKKITVEIVAKKNNLDLSKFKEKQFKDFREGFGFIFGVEYIVGFWKANAMMDHFDWWSSEWHFKGQQEEDLWIATRKDDAWVCMHGKGGEIVVSWGDEEKKEKRVINDENQAKEWIRMMLWDTNSH